MRKTDLAYTAGIVDGEGCITIRRNANKLQRGGYQIRLEVQVTNTNEWLINWLHFSFGGSTQEKPINGNRQRCWNWRVTGQKAVDFLHLVIPYLRIKRPHAEIAIQFMQNKVKGKHLTEAERAIEEVQRLLLKQYNKRGKEANKNV